MLDEGERWERISPENLLGLGYCCEGLERGNLSVPVGTTEQQLPVVSAGTLMSSHVFLSSFALAGPEVVGLPVGKYY